MQTGTREISIPPTTPTRPVFKIEIAEEVFTTCYCKSWRELATTTPTLWITKIIVMLHEVDVQQAQALLDNSTNSDSDIYFSMPENPGRYNNFMGWLDSKVFPLSHRVRVFQAAVNFEGELLFERFS
jgi:hypothetical protein